MPLWWCFMVVLSLVLWFVLQWFLVCFLVSPLRASILWQYCNEECQEKEEKSLRDVMCSWVVVMVTELWHSYLAQGTAPVDRDRHIDTDSSLMAGGSARADRAGATNYFYLNTLSFRRKQTNVFFIPPGGNLRNISQCFLRVPRPRLDNIIYSIQSQLSFTKL